MRHGSGKGHERPQKVTEERKRPGNNTGRKNNTIKMEYNLKAMGERERE